MSTPGKSHMTPARTAALATLAFDAVAAEVVAALAAAGVGNLLLKGPVTTRWLYGASTPRPYGDIDLLVAPRDLSRTGAVLASLGFARQTVVIPADEVSHHDLWVRDAPQVKLELHFTLGGVGVDGNLVFDAFARGASSMSIGGGRVAIPEVPQRCLLMALHAAAHGRPARKPMEDLARAIERTDHEDWVRAHLLAEELDAVPAMTAGLFLLPEGVALAESLGLDRSAVDLETHVRATTGSTVAVALARLSTARGVRAKARGVVRKLVPSPAFMRGGSSLARRGTLGLLASYALRLMSSPRALPGWVAMRRARRELG